MGSEYYLVNHERSTFFELGKGSWFEVDCCRLILYEPGLFLEFVKKVMEYDVEEDDIEYYKQLGLELFKFIQGTPLDRINVISDYDDETWYMRALKYKCVGSRYYLGDEEKNKEAIDGCNKHLYDKSDSYKLDVCEAKEAKRLGFNIKNWRSI